MPANRILTFGIFGNVQKESVAKLLLEIVNYLHSKKIKFVIDRNLMQITNNRLCRDNSAITRRVLDMADVILSLGGDGTFLNTARIVGNKNIPILGVNLGRLGFFSEVGPKEIKNFIPKIIKGEFRVTEQVIIKSSSGRKVLYGMNDIVIDKGNSIRMIETETYYNNEKVVKCVSDGIIISTPAGSTGYSLSCGGPIVNPESRVFVITPISPHTLNVRPIIVPDDGVIKIKIFSHGRAKVSSDGQKSHLYSSPSEIILTKADYSIKVIKKVETTYFDTIKKKLFWGEDKRQSVLK
jgi:NAD+ kinase